MSKLTTKPQIKASGETNPINFDGLFKLLSNENGNEDIACSVLDRVTDTSILFNNEGCSLLMLYISRREPSLKVMEKMLSLTGLEGREEKSGMNLLHVVAATDSLELFGLCVGQRREGTMKLLGESNKHGDSPVHYACAYGSEKVGVKMLDTLSGEGDGMKSWDTMNASGDGCLSLASRVKSDVLVQKLLDMETTCGGKDVAGGWVEGEVKQRLEEWMKEEGKRRAERVLGEVGGVLEVEGGRRKEDEKVGKKKKKKGKIQQVKSAKEEEDGLHQEIKEEGEKGVDKPLSKTIANGVVVSIDASPSDFFFDSGSDDGARQDEEWVKAGEQEGESDDPMCKRMMQITDGLSGAVAVDPSHLLYNVQQLALMSGAQLDVLEEVLGTQLGRVKEAKVIQSRATKG